MQPEILRIPNPIRSPRLPVVDEIENPAGDSEEQKWPKKNHTPLRPSLQKSNDPEQVRPSFRGGSRGRTPRQVIQFNWLAAFLDSMIILILAIVSILALSFVAKSSFFQAINWVLLNQSSTQFFLGALLLYGWTYVLTARVFMGATIGEWALDLRLGKPSERMNPHYVFRVFRRIFVVFVSGIFLLPLLSWFLKRDLAGQLSGGLFLYSLK